jgi:hypothetical protein
MASYGIDQIQISLVLDISKPTLEKYYRRELDIGAPEANSVIARSLFNKAKDGDVGAMIFWLKCRARWSPPPVEIPKGDDDGGKSIRIYGGLPDD